jgi:hypothetical protein
MAAGWKRHRSKAQVQRTAGTGVKECTVADSPKYSFLHKSNTRHQPVCNSLHFVFLIIKT